jgi:hypothetical protein
MSFDRRLENLSILGHDVHLMAKQYGTPKLSNGRSDSDRYPSNDPDQALVWILCKI